MNWTDPVMKFIDVSTGPRRIIGVAADIDDENIVPGPALTVYHPFGQEIWRRPALRARAQRPVRAGLADHAHHPRPVGGPAGGAAATLEDVRAEVLTPDRLNTLVFGGFAAVALAIAVVGVAGVLAFSVSGRTREFGIRLAIGSQPRQLLARRARARAWSWPRRRDRRRRRRVRPGADRRQLFAGDAHPRVVAARGRGDRAAGRGHRCVRMLPAARAARVDVMQALRSD